MPSQRPLLIGSEGSIDVFKYDRRILHRLYAFGQVLLGGGSRLNADRFTL